MLLLENQTIVSSPTQGGAICRSPCGGLATAAPCKPSPFLISRCGETSPLDRHRKGPGDSVRRLLPFFYDVFSERRSSTSRLEQPRSRSADGSKIDLAQNFRPRVSCRWCFHHSERLDTDAIDDAPCRVRYNRMGRVVSRTVPSPLSDVLGRAFGLSYLAIRRAAGTGRRPRHP